jgi:hypothetical protein
MSNKSLFQNEQENVHLLLAINRMKENDLSSHKEELCFRRPIYDYEEDLAILKTIISSRKGVWRIYKTVNPRNVEKARKILLHWLVDNMYVGKRFDAIWTKALMQRECRASKYALIDIDTKDVSKIHILENVIPKESIMQKIETPNGWHYICKPFDKRLLNEFDFASMDYDRFVFVEMIEVKGGK